MIDQDIRYLSIASIYTYKNPHTTHTHTHTHTRTHGRAHTHARTHTSMHAHGSKVKRERKDECIDFFG